MRDTELSMLIRYGSGDHNFMSMNLNDKALIWAHTWNKLAQIDNKVLSLADRKSLQVESNVLRGATALVWSRIKAEHS